MHWLTTHDNSLHFLHFGLLTVICISYLGLFAHVTFYAVTESPDNKYLIFARELYFVLVSCQRCISSSLGNIFVSCRGFRIFVSCVESVFADSLDFRFSHEKRQLPIVNHIKHTKGQVEHEHGPPKNHVKHTKSHIEHDPPKRSLYHLQTLLQLLDRRIHSVASMAPV